MNHLEQQMVDQLKYLKTHFGVVAVKAEFEAEGSRLYELMRLKDVSAAAGLEIVLKIGGPEAITDMSYAKQIGVNVLVAPMIESVYALKKFLGAIEKYFYEDERRSMLFCAMIETYQAYNCIDQLLDKKVNHIVNMITVGRVDLSGSLGLPRSDINCNKILKITTDVFNKAKKNGFGTTMGGGIAKEATPFIRELIAKKLLDRYETRKIVFDTSKVANTMEEGIIEANKFELMWLENKMNYYKNIASEDELRLLMLNSRIPQKHE